MYLKFDAPKAIQAAGVLLRTEHSKCMSRLRLLKLLVIADRESLRQTGRPILGSKIVAQDNGPLHSDIHDLIKGEHIAAPLWAKFFAQDGPRNVEMIDQPEVGLLSRFDIDLLKHVADHHAQIEDDALSEGTHHFPEWQKHHRSGASTPIPLEDIIDGVGREHDKAEILADLKDDAAFDAFFSRLGK